MNLYSHLLVITFIAILTYLNLGKGQKFGMKLLAKAFGYSLGVWILELLTLAALGA